MCVERNKTFSLSLNRLLMSKHSAVFTIYDGVQLIFYVCFVSLFMTRPRSSIYCFSDKDIRALIFSKNRSEDNYRLS